MDENILPEDAMYFAPLMEELNSSNFLLLVRESVVRELHPINPETGMPTLPAGYFWRVERPFSIDWVRLMATSNVTETRRKWHGMGEVTTSRATPRHVVSSNIATETGTATAKERIITAAYDALRFLPKEVKRALNPDKLDSYYGDYPAQPLTIDE